MTDSNDEPETTNRRSVLNTIAAGTLATSLFAGGAIAANTKLDGGGEGASNCETETTQYQCVDTACSCDDCGCDCASKEQSRSCCVDRYGNIQFCGSWTDTGDCCSSC